MGHRPEFQEPSLEALLWQHGEQMRKEEEEEEKVEELFSLVFSINILVNWVGSFHLAKTGSGQRHVLLVW